MNGVIKVCRPSLHLFFGVCLKFIYFSTRLLPCPAKAYLKEYKAVIRTRPYGVALHGAISVVVKGMQVVLHIYASSVGSSITSVFLYSTAQQSVQYSL